MYRISFFSFLMLLSIPKVYSQVDLSYEEITNDLLSTLEEEVYPYMLGVMSDEESRLFQEIEIRITDGVSISPASFVEDDNRVIEIDKGFLYLLFRVSERGYDSGKNDQYKDYAEYLNYIYEALKLDVGHLSSKDLSNKVKSYWRWKGEDNLYDEKETELYRNFREKNMKHILTYIIAHEFSHHYLGAIHHSDRKAIAYSEFDADTYGIELTYRSGRYLLPSRFLWDFYITVETIEDAKIDKATNENAFCRSARLRGFVSLAMRDFPAMRHEQGQLELLRKEADSLLRKGDCNLDKYNAEMEIAENEFNNIEVLRKSCDSLCSLGEFESVLEKYIEFENTFDSLTITRFRKASVLHKLLLRLTDEFEQYDVAITMTNEIIPLADEWGKLWLSQFHWIRANSHWYGKWIKTHDKKVMQLAKEDYLQCIVNHNGHVNAHMQMYFLSCFEDNAEQAIYHLEMVEKYGSKSDASVSQDISMLIQLIKYDPEKVLESVRNSNLNRKRTYNTNDD